MIRYCEEEVEINETVLFRSEIDFNKEWREAEFQLDCELYFADMNNLGGADNWKHYVKEI